MKAVILAGGLGTRMREETEYRPKPMVEIGGKPVLWHIMKNLSVQGFREFVILAGYKSEMIKNYFLNYRTNNYGFSVKISSQEPRFIEEVPQDELDWEVTVLDTGIEALTGQRLFHCINTLNLEEKFLLTYGDGLADVDVKKLIEVHDTNGRTATVTAVQASSRFGQLKTDGELVTEFLEKPVLDELVSIGFFILEPGVRNYLLPDGQGAFESLPIQRLVGDGQMSINTHNGFWRAMDTYREFQDLNQLWSEGAPWKIW